MDSGGRWRGLPAEPSLKHLTDPCYGVPRAQQKPALQELTQAHVESFNYAVREGLGHAVQVSAAPPGSDPRTRGAPRAGGGWRGKLRRQGERGTGWGQGPRGMAGRSQYNLRWCLRCVIVPGSSRAGEDVFVIPKFIQGTVGFCRTVPECCEGEEMARVRCAS